MIGDCICRAQKRRMPSGDLPMSTDLRARCAIAGLGQTRMGRNFEHQSATGFAAQAIDLALEDAGLTRTDLDGLLVNPGLTWPDATMASFSLQQAMGLRDLTLSATMNIGGGPATAAVPHTGPSGGAGRAPAGRGRFFAPPPHPPSPPPAQD